MKVGPVVRRYAKALFALAQEKKLVEDIGREVEFLGELFADRALGSFLRNPRITAAEKRKVFLGKVGPHISPLVRNFVNLLFDRGREEALEGIATAYRKIANDAMKIADGVVETAKPLDAAEKASLEKALSDKLGLTVRLRVLEVPSLIGGLRVTVGHRRIDFSVLSGLAALRTRWLQAPIK